MRVAEVTADQAAALDPATPCGGYVPCFNPATIVLHMWCGCLGHVCRPCRDEKAATWPDAGPAIVDCQECGSSTYAETWRDIVPREVPLVRGAEGVRRRDA